MLGLIDRSLLALFRSSTKQFDQRIAMLGEK
jgi:hypothetical protein